MGIYAIIDLLKSKPNKWFTASEIMNKLSLGNSSIYNSLLKIRNYKFIEYELREINGRMILHYRYKVQK